MECSQKSERADGCKCNGYVCWECCDCGAVKIHPRDCKKDCPGDPLCPYTDLARIQWRNEAWPAMQRLRAVVGDPMTADKQERWEILYKAVCAVHDGRAHEPVEGYQWYEGRKGGYKNHPKQDLETEC